MARAETIITLTRHEHSTEPPQWAFIVFPPVLQHSLQINLS